MSPRKPLARSAADKVVRKPKIEDEGKIVRQAHKDVMKRICNHTHKQGHSEGPSDDHSDADE